MGPPIDARAIHRSGWKCRLCGDSAAPQVLHRFGCIPVAGYLETDKAAAHEAPRLELDIALCSACGLVQQASDAARTILIERVYSQYQPTYAMSARVAAYMEFFLDEAVGRAGTTRSDTVVEVGSNDGSVLAMIAARGFSAIGFEPSPTLNSTARRKGATVVEDYFGTRSAAAFLQSHPKPRLVISRHTLEHAFEPLDFLRGIAQLLGAGGIAAIEVPYLRLQAMNNQFPSMTFQHVSFFTVSSMKRALDQAGLKLIDVIFVNMDGGSMIAFASANESRRGSDVTQTVLELEGMLQLDRPAGYERFFTRVAEQRTQIHQHLQYITSRGHTVLGYGAGSKGQALVNMLGCSSEELPFVIDDVPGNAGCFIPGPAIPIIASNDERARSAQYMLITAPTHVAEIVAKERERLGSRVRFLSIVPEFHYVSAP